MAYDEFTVCVSDYPSILLKDIGTGFKSVVEDVSIESRTYVKPHHGVVLGTHGTAQFFINSYSDNVLAVSREKLDRAVHSIARKCCASGDHCAGGYMSLDDEDNVPLADIGIEPAGGYGSPEVDDGLMVSSSVAGPNAFPSPTDLNRNLHDQFSSDEDTLTSSLSETRYSHGFKAEDTLISTGQTRNSHRLRSFDRSQL
ncbi:unnamed protein product [Calypogeia fissa]